MRCGMTRSPALLVAVAVVLLNFPALAAQPAKTLEVVDTLDFSRYAGQWHELARLPNRFEKKCVSDILAIYTPQSDGRIAVVNRCTEAGGKTNEAKGVARRVDGRPPSVLKVRFAPAFLTWLPAVWGDYQVMALGTDYEYALVGTPDRKFLWILSRTPTLAAGVYEQLLERATAQGFDVSPLVQTPVTPRTAGRPER